MRSEPYTNLVRLKMAMNGGRMPPMTPLSDAARKILDMSFTPGMGALEEDEEKGLRCPVAGCGTYFHRLDVHLRFSHKAIGGVKAVRAALDIPVGVRLISSSYALQVTDRLRKLSHSARPFTKGDVRDLAAIGRQGGSRSAGAQQSVAARNMKDSCDAQLTHRITDLANKIGRSPSFGEFEAEYGATVVGRVRAAFGSWANAKAHCDLKVYRHRRQITAADVLPGLDAWFAVHGELPGSADVARSSTPMLPTYRTILQALNAKTWPQAMEYAASFLNIYGGRYGLPVKKEAAAV